MGEVKERPILFSSSMVKALLDGRKTQTRRIVKLKDGRLYRRVGSKAYEVVDLSESGAVWRPFGGAPEQSLPSERLAEYCPYGKPGCRLWVKEAYRFDAAYDKLPPSKVPASAAIWYESDGEIRGDGVRGRYRSPRFMPRWASRITLEVTEVRVQRLQEISEGDAEDEGAGMLLPDHEYWDGDPDQYRKCFRELWESINGKGSWDQNPWLWCVSFKRLQGEG